MKNPKAVVKNERNSKLAELKSQMKSLREQEKAERDSKKVSLQADKIEITKKYIVIFSQRADRLQQKREKALNLVVFLQERLKKQEAENKKAAVA